MLNLWPADVESVGKRMCTACAKRHRLLRELKCVYIFLPGAATRENSLCSSLWNQIVINAEVTGRTFPNKKLEFTGININLFYSQGPLKKKKKNEIKETWRISTLNSATSDPDLWMCGMFFTSWFFSVSFRIQVEFYFHFYLLAVREFHSGKGYHPNIKGHSVSPLFEGEPEVKITYIIWVRVPTFWFCGC